jgi:hypothetical protein
MSLITKTENPKIEIKYKFQSPYNPEIDII